MVGRFTPVRNVLEGAAELAGVPIRDEKAWNSWLFIVAGDQLDQLKEQVTEVPELARRGYELELDELRLQMRNYRQFSRFVLDLEQASKGVLSQRSTPLEFGKSFAKKRLYTACVTIQRAATMPRDLEPTLP